MTAPLVSVVIKTFMRPEWLRITLNSILAQSYSTLEVLVFDNAADAATAQVVREIDDPRVVYTAREVNLGIFANAMDGMGRASGDYLLDFQDDDLLRPNFVEALVNGLEHQPDATIGFSDYGLVDNNGHLLPARHRWLRRYEGRANLRTGYYQPFTKLAARGSIFLSSALIRRGVIDWSSAPPEVGTSYDSWAVLRAAENGACAFYDERPLSLMRTYSASDSHKNTVALARGGIFALEEALERGKHLETKGIVDRLARRYSHLSRQYLIQGERQAAIDCAMRSWRLVHSIDSFAAAAASQLPSRLVVPPVRKLRVSYLRHVQHENVQ